MSSDRARPQWDAHVQLPGSDAGPFRAGDGLNRLPVGAGREGGLTRVGSGPSLGGFET